MSLIVAFKIAFKIISKELKLILINFMNLEFKHKRKNNKEYNRKNKNLIIKQ